MFLIGLIKQVGLISLKIGDLAKTEVDIKSGDG